VKPSIVPSLPWRNCEKSQTNCVAGWAWQKTLEEIAALNLEAAELLQQLRKIGDAVHAGNPAPHLRLVSDTE
jgi:hypothetical protein